MVFSRQYLIFQIRSVTKNMIDEAGRANLHVGYKQAMRALNENKAAKIFIAQDCDDSIKNGMEKLAKEKATPVEFVPTMQELGDICSIEVGASCAVILK